MKKTSTRVLCWSGLGIAIVISGLGVMSGRKIIYSYTNRTAAVQTVAFQQLVETVQAGEKSAQESIAAHIDLIDKEYKSHSLKELSLARLTVIDHLQAKMGNYAQQTEVLADICAANAVDSEVRVPSTELEQVKKWRGEVAKFFPEVAAQVAQADVADGAVDSEMHYPSELPNYGETSRRAIDENASSAALVNTWDDFLARIMPSEPHPAVAREMSVESEKEFVAETEPKPISVISSEPNMSSPELRAAWTALKTAEEKMRSVEARAKELETELSEQRALLVRIREEKSQDKEKVQARRQETMMDFVQKLVVRDPSIQAAWLYIERQDDQDDRSATRNAFRIHRNANNKIETVILERPEKDEVYVKTRNAGRMIVTEPGRRGVGNNGSARTVTFSSPIKQGQNIIGVCGIEVTADLLGGLDKKFDGEPASLLNQARCYVTAPSGKLVASTDRSARLGENFSTPHEPEGYVVESHINLARMPGQIWGVCQVVSGKDVQAADEKFRKANKQILEAVETYNGLLLEATEKTKQDMADAGGAAKKKALKAVCCDGVVLFVLLGLSTWGLRRKTRTMLDWQDRMQQQILDAIDLPLFIADTESQMCFRNKAASAKKLDLSAEAVKSCIQRNEQASRATTGEFVFSVRSQRILDTQGQICGVVQTFDDVTNREQTTRQMTDIRQMIGQARDGLREITASTDVIHEGALQTTDRLNTVTEKAKQSCQLSDATGQHASEANRYTSDAVQAAAKGQKEMTEMIRSMNEICEMSMRMQKVIKSIDEIAFQTNLLALNAAVEAARAGTHGKGFAVVAEEVRNLASRSAKAAKETSELIATSNKQILGGAGIANQTAEALNEITRMVEGATGLVSEIAKTSMEQSGQVQEIAQELARLEHLSQHNSEASEQASTAARALAEAVLGLTAEVDDVERSGSPSYKPANKI